MRKTPQMMLLEARDPQRRDIRIILQSAYQETGSTTGAAERLGIGQGTFSTWVSLLGGEIRSEVVFPRARRRAGLRAKAAA